MHLMPLRTITLSFFNVAAASAILSSLRGRLATIALYGNVLMICTNVLLASMKKTSS